MKKIVAIFIVMASLGNAYAKPVDVNTAKKIGYSFLTRNTQVVLANSAGDLQVAYTATSDINGISTPCYYAFNTGVANGFVIVSADDNVLPILGYSDEATFGVTDMPSQIKGWMDGYTQQISYIIKNNVQASSVTTAKWNDLSASAPLTKLSKTTSVAPLVTTRWDQTPYYNAMCPGTSGASQAVTGCVATAMAQVMKFWNWPATGVGSHSYNDALYGLQSADFGATSYSFASMSFILTGLSTAASKTAIATLMYHCGVSVDMNYNTAANNGSGAYVELAQSPTNDCAETALPTYFRYKPTLHGDVRAQYASEQAWINALETDLNAGRPVIYTGFGSDGGHCWVADGYATSTTGTTIHFNWGWSGASNGYFSVDSLAPPALGTGAGSGNFNSSQAAIFGIEPDYPAAVSNVSKNIVVAMYPNPANNVVNIDLQGTKATAINIIDMQGRVIKEITPTNSAIVTISTADFIPGIYMVQIHTDAEVITQKLSIAK
ncbi:MAG: thiol protease/hemagglutinin PrtT [Flavipsychrobacter sp.]|nr:thiol protease/hemagglutinin PrtT [Flavipsychrobacter sp.]